MHKGRVHKWGIYLSVCLSLLAAGHSLAAQPKVIRLATPGISAGEKQSSGTASVDYAYTQQLLEREFARDNIRIEWIFFKNAGPAINEAFANEQIDFALLGDLPAIIGEAAGNKTRLLASSARRINGYLGVVPGRGNHSLADLRGKTLGVWLGTSGHLALNALLAREGYQAEDFRLINLDFSASLAALAGKRVDAVWGAAGILSLNALGLADIVIDTQGNDGLGTITTLVLGSTPFVEQYPELSARLVRVFVQAAHWSSEPQERDNAIQLLADRSARAARWAIKPPWLKPITPKCSLLMSLCAARKFTAVKASFTALVKL